MRFAVELLIVVAAILSKAYASPVLVDQLSGYDPSTASESILGGGEVGSLFTIKTDAHIDSIAWAGMAVYNTPPSTEPALSFVVRIYNDASNGPNELVFEQETGPLSTESPTQSEPLIYSTGIYRSNTSINLQAGQYWISILGILNKNTAWYGATLQPNSALTILGSGGAGKQTSTSIWQPTNEGVTFYQGRGYAFLLQGSSAVPEPRAYISWLLGLFLVIFIRNRDVFACNKTINLPLLRAQPNKPGALEYQLNSERQRQKVLA